jgi:hypothetical protein
MSAAACETCSNGELPGWLIEQGEGRLVDRVPCRQRQREWAMTPCPDCNRKRFDEIWGAGGGTSSTRDGREK